MVLRLRRRKQHLDQFCVCLPLFRRDGLRVNVERDPAAGMAQELLSGLDIDA